MDKQLSVFKFNDYKVDSIDYKINRKFDYTESIDIDFDLKAEVSVAKDTYDGYVTLHLYIFEDAIKNNYPFELKTTITGYFSSDENCGMTKEEFVKYCELNGTTAMFPFVRSVVADITKAANMETLILPLMNIHKFIENNKNIENTGIVE